MKEFEDQLELNIGFKNVVTVNSGTSALHIALLLAGVKSGDEVIIPAQTFIATGLAVLYCGATPIFADIQYGTGNICPDSVRTKITNRTKAIIPVHWAGLPCDMNELIILSNEFNIVLIEDAAHALGAEYKNQIIGNVSDYTCFSFQAIKHLTTGDGGAVCCKVDEKVQKAKSLRWFGIDRKNSSPSFLGERMYDISEIGYKYHLNNYAAALGLANLSDFPSHLKRRVEISEFYNQELNDFGGVKLFDQFTDRKSACWLYGFHVEKRENFIQWMKSKGIPVSVVHQGIDKNSIFKGENKNLYFQRKFDESQIHIPLHNDIDKEQQEYIIDSIKKGW